MTYNEAIDYLYSRLPIFQNQGARAYKPGLTTTQALCTYLNSPQKNFRTIHVGGTNGKGSTSHMLASVLQAAGYRVGLYTSPHLKSFTERIRINGEPIDQEFISQFVQAHQEFIESIHPSFFEVTVAMAFDYFSQKQVDVAVIEVGMGGRLDSTNVILPDLSVITNISYDHMIHLGNTLPEIAFQKAGIIKKNIPVVISEKQTEDIQRVFAKVADEQQSHVAWASDFVAVIDQYQHEMYQEITVNIQGERKVYALDLQGDYQRNNIKGVLTALEKLRENPFYRISEEAIASGLRSVVRSTGLLGRWQVLQKSPFVVCDTAHNEAGISQTIEQFQTIPARARRFVLGFVADKDVQNILNLFPKEAIYYFCQPTNPRALDSGSLADQAKMLGIVGKIRENVNDALAEALKDSDAEDAIYVGGSTFVVADLNQL
ncbi:bifunctional folylpolyglutamate synthase/dihydrofolate synthase [Arundinibacter roseus]|uniref:Dihydrofolate synthase/folylpolyglutamate synthase n=1 Tax=Arundinibacter roseus TaxID=2070510 RepID=A0A4R4KFZ9_9BACT|nr:folylpolyglutamate synthase/dihydrofolate synthase family protein [Arundinibacter roseus]TDB66957.1 bifunctional folylpolyglutamate synthase/dihydrofolate synthase [Arundinibacter roseus]